MKIRFVFSAFCMLAAMTMATGAFAQATFQVSSGASQGRLNGHTEEAGGITLGVISGKITDETGTVVIDYGVPITNKVGKGDTDIIVTICGKDDDGGDETDIDGNTITVTASDDCQVVVGDDKDGKSSIDVSGVRLSLAGRGLDSVTATVGSTGSVRLLGGSQTLTVINSIKDELTDDGIDVDTKVTLIRHTGTVTTGEPTKFKLFITENTVSSFDGAQLNLDFSGIPDGVEVTLDAWVIAVDDLDDEKALNTEPLSNKADDKNEQNSQLAINTAKNLEAIVTAEDNKASVLTGLLMLEDETGKVLNDLKGGTLTTGRDVVIVMGLIEGADAEDLLPLDLDIQVTVDVGPIGVAIPKGDQSTSVPRFASDKTTAVTVIDSSSDQTEMKVSYVLSEGLYDTGIAVSNMTKDQAGAVHFALYMNGQELTHSTPMMAPQTTMTMLLSEVLTAAGHTGSFRGYMVITADFTEADASVFVSDFAGFTSASAVYQKRN